jgi:hypothetical protein
MNCAQLAWNGIFCSTFHGRLSLAERKRRLEAFQSPQSHLSEPLFDPKETVHFDGDQSADVNSTLPSYLCRTMIITKVGSTKVGNTGPNHQQADTVFFLDLPWDVYTFHRTTGRTIRVGRTNTVTAHLIEAEDTSDSCTVMMYGYQKTMGQLDNGVGPPMAVGDEVVRDTTTGVNGSRGEDSTIDTPSSPSTADGTPVASTRKRWQLPRLGLNKVYSYLGRWTAQPFWYEYYPKNTPYHLSPAKLSTWLSRANARFRLEDVTARDALAESLHQLHDAWFRWQSNIRTYHIQDEPHTWQEPSTRLPFDPTDHEVKPYPPLLVDKDAFELHT